MQHTSNTSQIVVLALLMMAVCLAVGAQDQGFDVISEGVIDPSAGLSFDASVFGNAGYSIIGTLWASAGAQIGITLDAFEMHARASAGTDGTQVQGGISTELFGFGVGGDVTYSLGSAPVIMARGWGEIAGIGVSANASLAGTAISLLLGANMDLEMYGISASLGFANGAFTTASLGANTSLGALSLSANGGWAGAQFTLGGGASLVLGLLQVTANAGYSEGLGINAVLSVGLELQALQMTAVAMLDNTGMGMEATGQLALGDMVLSAISRFGGGDFSAEVGLALPFGALSTSVSVAFDNATGFAWAEASFDLPL